MNTQDNSGPDQETADVQFDPESSVVEKCGRIEATQIKMGDGRPTCIGIMDNECGSVNCAAHNGHEMGAAIKPKLGTETKPAESSTSSLPSLPGEKMSSSDQPEVSGPQIGSSAKPRRKEAVSARKRKLDEDESDKFRLLMANFSGEQLERYEVYRRSSLPVTAVRKLIHSVTGAAVSQDVVIAISGIAKIFVCDIVEEAVAIEEKWSETGPIQPRHIREAVRILKNKGVIPTPGPNRRNPFPL